MNLNCSDADCFLIIKETYLLVSKSDGIFRAPFRNLSLLVPWKLDSVRKPKEITHDPWSGNTFWLEDDVIDKTSRLLRHDVGGKVSVVLNRTHDGIREGSQGISSRFSLYYVIIVVPCFTVSLLLSPELQAFAVDGLTGNIYMAFGNDRRLRVCNTTVKVKCTEILGNQVEDTVKGLAIHSESG